MKLLLASFVMLIAFGCGSSQEACLQTATACAKGGRLQACCTATDCRYLGSDGSSFDCMRTDCSQAAMLANAWCQTH